MTTARLLPVIASGSSSVREQLGNPSGWLGDLVGRVMATSNAARSRWVLAQLGLEPPHHVLEVGFGPGVDIERAAERVKEGIVAGVDHSPTMLKMASARNAAAIDAGRVHLEVASVARLPFFNQTFDRIFSINCVQFWPDLRGGLDELRRVLKPGGRVAVAIQPRQRGATRADSLAWRDRLETAMRAAGYADVEPLLGRTRPVATACVLGTRPTRPGR
jgi:ubiquinone/menaquinone biosynthesis C-methylase UbiE